jgi:hypothetical protein
MKVVVSPEPLIDFRKSLKKIHLPTAKIPLYLKNNPVLLIMKNSPTTYG